MGSDPRAAFLGAPLALPLESRFTRWANSRARTGLCSRLQVLIAGVQGSWTSSLNVQLGVRQSSLCTARGADRHLGAASLAPTWRPYEDPSDRDPPARTPLEPGRRCANQPRRTRHDHSAGARDESRALLV